MGRPDDEAVAGQRLQVYGGQTNGSRQVSCFVVGLRQQGYVGRLGFYARFKCGICSRVQMFVIRTRKCRFSCHFFFIFYIFQPCSYASTSATERPLFGRKDALYGDE